MSIGQNSYLNLAGLESSGSLLCPTVVSRSVPKSINISSLLKSLIYSLFSLGISASSRSIKCLKL